jgi:DNA-binding response OmpR family regulator
LGYGLFFNKETREEVITVMSKKVMILEDDEAIAELIKFYLHEEGFQVAVSTRGNGFIAKVAEYQPDLITLDVLLPDADGFTIFKELQKDARTRNVPVIFITVKEGEKENGIKMGASGYIVKPFNEKELKNTIKSVLDEEDQHGKDTHSG